MNSLIQTMRQRHHHKHNPQMLPDWNATAQKQQQQQQQEIGTIHMEPTAQPAPVATRIDLSAQTKPSLGVTPREEQEEDPLPEPVRKTGAPCIYCGAGFALYQCTGCLEAYYCSPNCQRGGRILSVLLTAAHL